MTNVRSGTWMMTGNGVMHNGTTIIDDYGINLDKLKVGDRVAVVRKENGTIHFFVNSEDQVLRTVIPRFVQSFSQILTSLLWRDITIYLYT